MDKETFEILQKYDKQFNNIKDSNYCRIPGRTALQELNDVYMKLFQSQSRLLNGCSACVFDGLRRLSVEYFNEISRQSEPKTVSDSESATKRKRKNNKSQIDTQNGRIKEQ